MSQAENQPSDQAAAAGGGVRRHHTISSSSRLGRSGARDEISEEQDWNEDEVVGDEWVGGVGAVGEKSQLHRQASLPTKYHRPFQNAGSNTRGSSGLHRMNSLTAIASHDNEEEDWVKDINDQHAEQQQSATSPISPLAPNQQMVPSPPPADSGVRRHVSLTYGAQARNNKNAAAALKRSGTLQTPLPPHPPEGVPDGHLYIDEQTEDFVYNEEPAGYEEDYYNKPAPPQQQQLPPQNQYGRSSPWSPGNEWRAGGNGAVDDVSRALSSMDIGAQQQQQQPYPGNYAPAGQTSHPPRFNNVSAPGPYRPAPNSGGSLGDPNDGRQVPVSSFQDGRRTPSSQTTNAWEQRNQQGLTGRRSNPNLQYGYQQGHNKTPSTGSNVSGHGGQSPMTTSIPSVPPIPQQYLQQQQQQQQNPNQPRAGLGLSTNVPTPASPPMGHAPVGPLINTPIDVPSLIATKGYNPAHFDIRPPFARYFVIKSYTEDDVHKSLKYEIWSSTDPGNKRLDKAFKDCAGRGPIYLFFSVNASGHFCGMAEMLTPVDYTKSSTVWASDKWKGVFKVRWIFVRDIPNVTLRHIKLNNTQERKPVTNSRDTQELLPDAGQEMLRIFHTHPARTSLLQDFAFYELQAMQKVPVPPGQPGSNASPSNSAIQSPQLPSASPNLSPQQPIPQHQYAQPGAFGIQQNPNALAYTLPQMSPMMQMQMMGQPGQFANNGNGGLSAQSQAIHNNVLRNPSPAPQGNPW